MTLPAILCKTYFVKDLTVIPFTIDFAKIMRAKKLKLSPKGSVLSNTPSRTRILHTLLAKSGVKYNAAESVRDLGVAYTAGTRRPTSILLERLREVKNRILKVKHIASASISRLARKLFTGAAYAAATWGHQSSGLSPNQVADLEKQALDCTGLSVGRCRTTSLVVCFGLQGNPMLALSLTLFLLGFTSSPLVTVI